MRGVAEFGQNFRQVLSDDDRQQEQGAREYAGEFARLAGMDQPVA